MQSKNSPQQQCHWLAKKFTMMDRYVHAIAACNNRIIILSLFPFSPCNYLIQGYILGWLFSSFRNFLRFDGKFDCQILQFFFGHFVHEKNHFSISEPPFLTLLLRITDRQQKESMWMLAWVQSCMLVKKRYVLSAFFCIFLLMNIDSLFLIRILTFSFPFLNRSNPMGFRKGFKKEWQAHCLSSSPALCFWPRTTIVIDQGCCGSHVFSL